MSGFVVAPGLSAKVAARFGAPAVDRLKRALENEARRRAPKAKVWVTAHDERVRPSHVATDGQAVPDNLRFILPKSGHDNLNAGRDLARAPRDTDLPIGNRINCRCTSVSVPELIKQAIQAGPTVVEGAQARARVTARFPRVVESEYPDQGDSGGGWMAASVNEVAARRKGQARRT